MSDVLRTGTSYLSGAFHDRDTLIDTAKTAIGRRKFDTMVGTGLSGSLVVPRLADVFGCHWLILRKPGENRHSMYDAEGTVGKRWIIVDDLIDSGATAKRMIESMDSLCSGHSHKSKFAGAYLYDDWRGAVFLDADAVRKRVGA